MGIVSRLQLNHPALGALGGASLHDSVEGLYEKIGDNMNSRFLTADGLSDSASVDLVHNFNVDFSDLTFLVYERNPATNELIQRLTTGFILSATSGAEKLSVNVANSSGSAYDIAVIAVHGAGSGGGGGGSLSWTEEPGTAPLTDIDSAIGIYIFEQGITQKLTATIKVPESYIPGTQITMLNYVFKDGVSNNYAMETVTTLIRPSLDAIDSTLNQVSSTTLDLQAAVPKLLTEFTTSLTTGIGEINGQAVGPGDLLKVELSRVAPSGTDTTDDIKFIPDSTEVSFG